MPEDELFSNCKGTIIMKPDLIQFFSEFITPERKKLFGDVLLQRTRYITVVLEDIFQGHNASAILRSCDCFGIQDVHVVENRNHFTVNEDIALGSSKWLTLKRYSDLGDNSAEAINSIRKEGYRIVAASLDSDSVPLHEFDVSKGKLALLFGTEKEGLSDESVYFADEKIRIPMLGFTESFNVSVSVALILYELTNKMRNLNLHYQLSMEEKNDIELDWLRKSVRNSDLVEKEFLNRNR